MFNFALVAVLLCEMTHFSNTKKSWLAAAMSCGFFVGCAAGYFSDCWGRVYVFKRQISLTVVGTVGLACSTSYGSILAAVFILGIGAGADEAVANTIALESFPPSQRSKVTLISLAWSLGLVFGYSLAFVLVFTEVTVVARWRMLAFCAAGLAVLAVALRVRLQETPGFLYEKQRHHEFNTVLAYIETCNKTSPLMYTALAGDPPVPKPQRLFVLKFLPRTLTMGAVYFLYSFAFSGIFFFMPTLLQTTDSLVTFGVVAVQQSCGAPGQLLATYLVDGALGRKLTWALGFSLSAVSLMLILCVENVWGLMVVTSVHTMFFNMGISALFTHSQELFPESVRSKSSGLFIASARIGSMVGPLVAGILIDKLGVGAPTVLNGLCLVLVSVLSATIHDTKKRQ